MFSQRKVWSTLALLSLVVISAAKADPAPEPKGVTVDDTKWMLPDAEFFVKFNVKQMMTSDLMTKGGIAKIKEAIKNNEQLKGVLDATDLDITRDLDSILASGTIGSGKDARGLVVIRGKFDQTKMQDALEKAAKKDDKLKIVKEGGLTLYEFPAGETTMVAAFTGKDTMVLTHSKEATVAAVKEGGKKAATLSAGMKSGMGSFNGKESFAMVVVLNADIQKMLANIPNAGATASKLTTVTTAVTLTDAVALDIAGVTGDADSAKKLSNIITTFKAVGAGFLADNEQVPPIAIEMYNAIKVKAGKEAVHIKLDVTKEMLQKAGKGEAK